MLAVNRILCALVVAGVWATFSDVPALAQGYGSDPIPFTPYGMDAVPPTRFYRGVWNHYGSDPVPRSATSDLGFHDVYGLDPIPPAVLPSVDNLHNVLPNQALQVLTGAVEGGPVQSTGKPGRCP